MLHRSCLTTLVCMFRTSLFKKSNARRLECIPGALSQLQPLYFELLEKFTRFVTEAEHLYKSANNLLCDKTTSLRELPEAERRAYAKAVNSLCSSVKNTTAYSPILFEVKKLGLRSMIEFVTRLDPRKIFFYMFNSVNTKYLCL